MTHPYGSVRGAEQALDEYMRAIIHLFVCHDSPLGHASFTWDCKWGTAGVS